MWIAKFIMRHDCILGNRCRKFNVTLQGVAFSVFKKGRDMLSSSMIYASGRQNDIERFYIDLKKDKAVTNLEQKGATALLVEKAKSKAVQFYDPKLIFVKPVIMDECGFEHWEVGSWEKMVVMKFVSDVKSHVPEFKLERFTNVKIDNVFFPRLMPNLTDKQKETVELAIREGYYETPRKTDLRKLAKLMKCSLSTYEQHLRSAEKKMLPNVLSYF